MAAPAAPTIVAELESNVNAVRLTVTPKTGTVTLNVWRTGPSGVIAGVRGAYPLTGITSTAAQIIRDFEAPIGVPLTYYATGTNAGGETSTVATATITIPDGGCDDTWLTDIARPTNTQKIVIENLAELAYAVPSAVHSVLVRRAPIVTLDVARTPTFELLFLTATEDERERARACLGNAVPVLLRTPPENGIGNIYMAVTEFAEQRIVQRARVQDRRFVCQCVQVDRPPAGIYVPLGVATYAHVRATFATYQALKDGRATYDAVLYDYAGAEAGDIVPWPPDDV